VRLDGTRIWRIFRLILNPSRSIQPRFTNYLVVMRDGRMIDGLEAGMSRQELADLIAFLQGANLRAAR